MAQKITRKKLLKEPDEFLTFSARLLQGILAYRTHALIGVAALLGIGILISGYQMLHRSWEKEAFNRLHSLSVRYEKAQKADGPGKAFEAMQQDFETFFKEDSGRKAAAMGLLYWGNVCVQAGQIDKAIEVYRKAEQAFQDDPLLLCLARSALGHQYLRKADADQAIPLFETLASSAETTPAVAEDALVQLAAIYRQRKDEPKSKSYLHTLLQKYPNSIYKEMAQGETTG